MFFFLNDENYIVFSFACKRVMMKLNCKNKCISFLKTKINEMCRNIL